MAENMFTEVNDTIINSSFGDKIVLEKKEEFTTISDRKYREVLVPDISIVRLESNKPLGMLGELLGNISSFQR